MATEAAWLKWEQSHGKKKAKCALTSTGLLMEGLSSVLRSNSGRIESSALNWLITNGSQDAQQRAARNAYIIGCWQRHMWLPVMLS